MNSAGDVVHGKALLRERRRLVVRDAGTRVGEAREPGIVRVHLLEQRLIPDRRRDHLAAFLALANGEHLHARRVLLQFAEVGVDLLGIGQLARRARDIAKRGGRGGDAGFGGRQVIGER